MPKTTTSHPVWIPGAGHHAYFTPRHTLRRAGPYRMMSGEWPTPTLPVGYTNVDNSIIPIDGNDRLGDCGPCMGAHIDNVLTFRAGGVASVMSDLNAFEWQYETISGGDNGTNEDQMVGPIWGAPNGIAGITPSGAVLEDHLNITTDPTTVQGAIAAMGFVCLAFSVPDRWINTFNSAGGSVWDAPAIPDPMHGHYVALVGVDANGNYILLTWGSYALLTPAGMQVCQPELFTGWTNRMFNPQTGLAFDGQTFDQKAAVYKAAGGSPPANPFPQPAPGPSPGPVPTPAPVPQPAPTPGAGWSGSFLSGSGAGMRHHTVVVKNGVITGVQ